MPTISFSTPWTLRSIPYLFRLNTYGDDSRINAGLLTSAGPYSGQTYSVARIEIMQGAVPTSLVGLETIGARSADLLVSFTCPSSAPSGSLIQYFLSAGLGQPGSGDGTNPQIINTIYKNAVGSGTATWFRWLVLGMPNNLTDPTSVIHQIVGTVSANGGGGDVQMDSTAITAGQPYRISSIQFYTPTSFTY
jgi:hypothetical protein